MARFSALAAPPQSLDTLDRWGRLDSLPASLDSPLWNSAGLWELEAEALARSSQAFESRLVAALSGELASASGERLAPRLFRLLSMDGRTGTGGAFSARRLRPLRARGAARAEASCHGVGVLYLAMGGSARSGGGLALALTASLKGREAGAGNGALSLHFVRLLSLGAGAGEQGAALCLGVKGWNWNEAGRAGGLPEEGPGGAPGAVPGGPGASGGSFWEQAARPSAHWTSAASPAPQDWTQPAKFPTFWINKEERRASWL